MLTKDELAIKQRQHAPVGMLYDDKVPLQNEHRIAK